MTMTVSGGGEHPRRRLTFISLFAGIGGFDLALERAGFECVAQVEIDAAARSVLSRHWPDVPKFADVRDVGAHNLPVADLITFGSPCQDLSVAGKRAGMTGERSGLFYEAIRIIRELRPTLALWENVPGALSSAQGRDFGAAIDALADAGALDICWRVLDAQWFGVAQRRRRVFTLADFRAERAAEILFESEGVHRDSAPSREAGQDVAGTIGGSSQSGGFRTTDLDNNGAFIPVLARSQTTREGDRQDGESCTFVPYTIDWQAGSSGDTSWRGKARSWIVDKPGRARSLTANRTLAVAHALTGEGFDASEDGTGRGTPLVPIAIPILEAGKRAGPAADDLRAGMGIGDTGDPMFTLQAGAQHAVAFAENQRAEVRTSDVVLNITNGGGKPGQGYPAVQTGMAVRRLTPRECERLQGFPDDWTAGQADSSRYRQLGNAVAVPVIEWIARRIVEALW